MTKTKVFVGDRDIDQLVEVLDSEGGFINVRDAEEIIRSWYDNMQSET